MKTFKKFNDIEIQRLADLFIYWYEDTENIHEDYFDVRKIIDIIKNNDVIFITGEYDDGKSVAFKIYSMYMYLTTGKQTLRPYNGDIMLMEDYNQFADFYKLYPELEIFKKLWRKKDKYSAIMGLEDEAIYFLKNIANDPKAGRIEKLAYMVYDEANFFNSNFHKNKQYQNLPILMTRMLNSGEKIFIIGNNLTASVPVFQFFNIYKIPDESVSLSIKKDNLFDKGVNIYYYHLKTPTDKKKAKYENKPYARIIANSYASQNITYNISKDVLLNDIISYFDIELLEELSIGKRGIKIGDEYYTCFLINGDYTTSKKGIYHIAKHKNTKTQYALNKESAFEKIPYNPLYNRELARKLLRGTLQFNDVWTFEKVFENIQAYMSF